MLRVLLVPLGWTPEDSTSGRTARVLRDAGHEVVHGGSVSSAAQIAACALQEDVDLVLLLADDASRGLVNEISGLLPEELTVALSVPDASRAEVLDAVAGALA